MARESMVLLKNNGILPINKEKIKSIGDIVIEEVKVISELKKDSKLELELTISNQGDYNTDDVIQVYIKDLKSSYAVKNHKLCAFKRVKLLKGQSLKTKLTIDKKAFYIVDNEGKSYCDSDEFIIYLGTSQPDERSRKLTGKEPIEIKIKL